MKRQLESAQGLPFQDDLAKRPKQLNNSKCQPEDKNGKVSSNIRNGTSRFERWRVEYERYTEDLKLPRSFAKPPPLTLAKELLNMVYETALMDKNTIKKLQGSLAAERKEGMKRKETIGILGGDLVVVQQELRSEKEKNKFHEAIVAQQEKDILVLQNSSSAEKRRCINLEKRFRKLRSELRDAKLKVEDETEKSLCSICGERQRNALTLPCLHLCCCFQCLETHLKKSKTCPCCTLHVKGTLECAVERFPTLAPRHLVKL